MSTNQNYTSLADQMFGTDAWTFSHDITSTGTFLGGDTGALQGGALAFLGLFLAFQFFTEVSRRDEDLMGRLVEKVVIRGAIVAAIIWSLTPYFLLIKAMAVIPEQICVEMYDNDLSTKVLTGWKTIGEMQKEAATKGNSFIIIDVASSMGQQLLTTITFYLMSAVAFVTPLFQRILFNFLTYGGIITLGCLGSEKTASYFDTWFKMLFSTCMLSVMSVISIKMMVEFNLLSTISSSGGVEELMTVLVYCSASIMLFIASPAITFQIFGGGGALAGFTVSNAISSAAGMAAGVMVANSGTMAQKGAAMAGEEGASPTQQKIGNMLENIGEKIHRYGEKPGTASSAFSGKRFGAIQADRQAATKATDQETTIGSITGAMAELMNGGAETPEDTSSNIENIDPVNNGDTNSSTSDSGYNAETPEG